MKTMKKRHAYSSRRVHSYAYPNAAERGYFAGKILDGITVLVSCMGTITLFFYLVTI